MDFDSAVLDHVFEFARAALTAGERPVAALLVHTGKIVAEATDSVFASSDPTAYADRPDAADLHWEGCYCSLWGTYVSLWGK